ncbi:MAG: PKD domain-containing protein [Bacteroidales bacterium]|nr:PKD domain-containing protein [Bacteroidales bacterium]
MKKIYFIFFAILITLSSCEKKGNITINNLDYYIKNNTAPYEVELYRAVTYQPSEATITWDFGDGTTSNDKSPVHIYEQTGKYNVKLTIVNYKTISEETIIIDVSQDPMPIKSDFDYHFLTNKRYAPCEVQFYNTSQYASDFFWNFDDGLGSNDDSPSHIFDSVGIHRVYLYAMSGGDTAASVLELEILPPPEKISVDVVSIWLPGTLLGEDYSLYYYLDIFNETPTNLPMVNASTIPFGWIIDKELFFFNGEYNSDNLYFEVWSPYNNQAPTYSFGIRMEEIQDLYYPDTLFWDNGNGYAAEVLLSYYDD